MAARFVFTEAAETQLLEILDSLADESESAAGASRQRRVRNNWLQMAGAKRGARKIPFHVPGRASARRA